MCQEGSRRVPRFDIVRYTEYTMKHIVMVPPLDIRTLDRSVQSDGGHFPLGLLLDVWRVVLRGRSVQGTSTNVEGTRPSGCAGQ